MNASRLQHSISATVILIVAIAVTWISFTQQPADAFLFPRLISIFFCALAAWNFIRAISGMARVGEGLDTTNVIAHPLFAEFRFVLKVAIDMDVFR